MDAFYQLFEEIVAFDSIQQVIRYFQTIAVSDLVDVAIIAFIFYRLILLIRNTQAGQVFKGVFLVIGFLWLSDLFNLHVLNFILESLVQVGFLALIVVFQPEIRHFLGQVGSGNLKRYLKNPGERDELEIAITQTVQAYRDMSRSKTGALTVFERNSILNDFIRTGTQLDAAVSSELLKNIFWNKAPLHDGAVIIRAGRIVGAGCVLPLSGNVNISRELGTRHRAGIGVTEHTDAVVVICSEETGSISVAVEGTLRRHLAPETLERMLRNELLGPADEAEKKDAGLLPLNNLLSLFKVKKEGGDDHVE
ncbi:MAG TPA: TIGR00159 family protein [Candidatus Onthomonas avicola]|nr:TIGR00159 family protein [Candidatus Onthomonas avicola]